MCLCCGNVAQSRYVLHPTFPSRLTVDGPFWCRDDIIPRSGQSLTKGRHGGMPQLLLLCRLLSIDIYCM